MILSRKIYRAAVKFLAPLTIEETYAMIVTEAMKLVNAELGSILLEKDVQLERAYASDSTLYTITPRKNGYMHTVAKTLKPKLLDYKQIAKVHPEITKTAARSDIIVPLAYKDKSIGVLTVMSRKDRHFTKQDFQILQLFAPLATLAIKKMQLYDETLKALETRDLFISMASHELRTPLTTIYAYMQLMQLKMQNHESPDPVWIDTMLNETMRLNLLVNELLQVDQINRGKLQYNWKKCDLTEIANRAVMTFRFGHQNYLVKLEDKLKTKPTCIYADYDKIIQVITNLLNNATKFSPKKSQIIVRLENNTKGVAIKVIDHGKGIAEKDLPNIFEEYYRGDNHRHEGMGLGLFLTKNIITEHKGEITVTSKLNKGTMVTIMLPEITSNGKKRKSRQDSSS